MEEIGMNKAQVVIIDKVLSALWQCLCRLWYFPMEAARGWPGHYVTVTLHSLALFKKALFIEYFFPNLHTNTDHMVEEVLPWYDRIKFHFMCCTFSIFQWKPQRLLSSHTKHITVFEAEVKTTDSIKSSTPVKALSIWTKRAPNKSDLSYNLEVAQLCIN